MSVLNARINSYHFHVYYDSDHKDIAADVRQSFLQAVERNHDLEESLRVGRMHDEPVGPHTKPMFQIAVDQFAFQMSLNFLMLHRQGLTVLIHPETGDDIKDHTIHAAWLGNKVALDLTKL